MRDREFWLLIAVMFIAPHLPLAAGIGGFVGAIFWLWRGWR